MPEIEIQGRVEIHTHSTVSDGVMRPDELAQLAKSSGVSVWSLTDHDTCEGCEQAAHEAQRLGIKFIPGIEISAYAQQSIHVLGYNVDPASEVMRDYGQKMTEARAQRIRQMIMRLEQLGMAISFEEVEAMSERGLLGRPHLARTMLQKGYVSTLQEAFDHFLAEGQKGYVAMRWPSVEEAIALIHQGGGIAVLAHPARYNMAGCIQHWVDAGLDGIEVRHPSHDLLDEQKLSGVADRYGLLKTASSDFHGYARRNQDTSEAFGRVNFPDIWLEPFLETVFHNDGK